MGFGSSSGFFVGFMRVLSIKKKKFKQEKKKDKKGGKRRCLSHTQIPMEMQGCSPALFARVHSFCLV